MAVVIMLGIPALILTIRGTRALLQWLVLRAGVRSSNKAFLVAFFLTPVVLVGIGYALHFALQWRGAL